MHFDFVIPRLARSAAILVPPPAKPTATPPTVNPSEAPAVKGAASRPVGRNPSL
mgnify:CR=1 FL=1